jgi:hypothetical protein
MRTDFVQKYLPYVRYLGMRTFGAPKDPPQVRYFLGFTTRFGNVKGRIIKMPGGRPRCRRRDMKSQVGRHNVDSGIYDVRCDVDGGI